MRKLISIVLVATMVFGTMFCMTSCGGSDSESDLAYVQDNNKLVVGITDFAPMDYKEDGEWVGFDADMAREFADYIGVDEVEFVEIDWDEKELELEDKSIDCVWNGMTITKAAKKAMSVSNPYCNNAQVVVVNSADADKYQDEDSIKDLVYACEAGSAGAEIAKENGYDVTEVQTQAKALMEVKAGTANACIIDLLMAGAMIGEGTSYPDLTYTVELSSEKYGVGFRQDSDLTDELNSFFKESYDDGTMLKIAKKYGVQESLVDQD